MVYNMSESPPCSGFALWNLVNHALGWSLSLSLKWTLLQLWESAKTTIAGLHVSHLGDPPEGNMWFQVALPPFASELCTSFNWALSCSTVGIIKLCGCCGNWGNTDVVFPSRNVAFLCRLFHSSARCVVQTLLEECFLSFVLGSDSITQCIFFPH